MKPAMSFVQIARVMGTTPQNVQQTYQRAIRKLRACREISRLRDLYIVREQERREQA